MFGYLQLLQKFQILGLNFARQSFRPEFHFRIEVFIEPATSTVPEVCGEEILVSLDHFG